MVEWLTPENAALAEATEAAMRTFEGEQRKLADLQQKMEEDSSTVRSKDRSLSMTFDGRGELTGMKFHGTKFRSMAPAELAHLIVETVRAGRTQYLEKISENAGTSALLGVDFADLATGRADAGKIVESMLAPLAGQLGDFWESAFGSPLSGSGEVKGQVKGADNSADGKTERERGK
ncbi:YbaB/EbfC family nucleoid-associated protein [Amycolatopsis pigmentata]|uniref:YbaB/EbfC family nucleoid-associated protein n=1 Tax=Amycolatopsis pigmentata TaxID=450801 RepID=A0ABW5G155_9PSEU